MSHLKDQNLSLLEQRLLLQSYTSRSPSDSSDTGLDHDASPQGLLSSPLRSDKSPRKTQKGSRTTCPPSSSSELTEALLALRDLTDATPRSANPVLLSALQEARLVLRKHGLNNQTIQA